ncbi:MAG TPA: hypothetical protein VFC65_01435 [Prolixibacteraceae bacterium]|nr:hypothetical protein [Prolixibacteraceae bacterium]
MAPIKSDTFGRALRGIEIPGLSVIDADTRLNFHLGAVKTPSPNCLQDNELSLIDWYAAEQFANPGKLILDGHL